MQIVILGMHRSGTSLTASIVSRLGVNVGDSLLGTHPSQKHGHWEDVDFYELNMDILKAAGGDWRNPPSERDILLQKPRFEKRISSLIEEKSKRKSFAWKDPRTCLTLPLYLPHLIEPRFILVYRDMEMIVNSLLKRSKGSRVMWETMTRQYHECMEKYTMSYDVLRVEYGWLVNKHLARQVVENINAFIGGNGEIDGAINLIEFRI